MDEHIGPRLGEIVNDPSGPFWVRSVALAVLDGIDHGRDPVDVLNGLDVLRHALHREASEIERRTFGGRRVNA